MDKGESLEKRAKKHAKAMFEQNPSISVDAKIKSVLYGEAGTSLENVIHSNVSISPKKKKGKSLTPRKYEKKNNSSSTPKKGQLGSKSHEKTNTEMTQGEHGTSSSMDDLSDAEEDLDRNLSMKAQNINLSKRNVKSIIHHLLTNEHVIKLYKDVLGAQEADNAHGSPVKSNVGSLDSFPKMTRSKVKDFMEKSNIPSSPCKKPNSGPSILEVDFAEEEDDDEYSPEKDETNETDDDESVISSYLSEFGSPCPVTPSTPVPIICHERPTLSMSPSSINSPLASMSSRLKIDLSGCEGLSETEDEGTIALRTRSKKSLTDTSLMDIEQAFVAPDITPDMYDTGYQDKDWADFLSSLYKTNVDESTADDEANDPEFNYIAEAEEEALDDEDFRFDKPTKVSKKELNSLIEELHNLFEDEVLPLQVVAEASNTQDPISQFVSSNLKENPTPAQSFNRLQQPTLPAEVQAPPTFSPQNSQIFISPPYQIPQPNLPLNNQCSAMPSCSQYNLVATDSNFKVPYLPSQSQSTSTCFQQSMDNLKSSSVVQHYERMIIQDQIRKHIQLLTQTFLLSLAENQSNKDKISNSAKEMLMDLNSRKLAIGLNSAINVCNLEESVQLVLDHSDSSNRRAGSCVVENMDGFKIAVFLSPVFMYPHLLPTLGEVTNRNKKSSKAKSKFTQSEDNLIALGLEQFSTCTGAFPSEFIQKYLMPYKSVNEIYHRIMFLSSTKSGINHVKKLRKLKQPVQLEPPIIHPTDFRPPRLKFPGCLPQWCQELQNYQASSRNIIDSRGKQSTPVNNYKSVKETFVTIKPKSTSGQSQNISSSVSSVISLKTKQVSNRTSKNNQKSKSKEKGSVTSDSFAQSSPSSFFSDSYAISPLRVNNSDIELSHSPDLLKKVMNSCGIGDFPSPSSSSTPLPVDKPKPASVKNLRSAFDESEIITKNNLNRSVRDKDTTVPSESNNPLKTGSLEENKINKSNSSNMSHSHEDSGASSPLHPSRKLISVDETSHSQSMEVCCDSNLTQVKTGTIIDKGEAGEIMPGMETKQNSNKKSTKTNIEPPKKNIIQLTVIKKPKFQNCQEISENTKKAVVVTEVKKDKDLSSHSEHLQEIVVNEKGDKAADDVVNKVEKRFDPDTLASGGPVSPDDPPSRIAKDNSAEANKNDSGDSGSSSKLAPWISSIISQFETQDPDPGTKNSKPTTKPADSSDSSVKEKTSSTPADPDLADIPLEIFKSPDSSPIKVAIFPATSPKRTPLPIAPKTSPCPKSTPYVPLPRVSPKRKELNRQVRQILPKSFVFETKSPSPTKTKALNLKKKATLICQKSPVKILPRPDNVSINDRDVGIKTKSRSTMLTRSQRGISKPKRKEEPSHKAVKRVKKTEEEYESSKETESEASEIEESGLSQEEDDDRTKLDDLMAASTTIRFGSKQPSIDEDIKSKAARRKALSLSLLQPDLVQNDPKKDDRDTAFAQQYFNQVKETLSSDPDRFYKFLSLLKDLNKDHTSPVELYLDMVMLLSDHQQLVEDFAGFLLSFQAVECQCFSTSYQYNQIRQFLRQVEVHCGSSTGTYRKVLKALSTWSSMCQEGKLKGSLRDKMLTILRSVPGVLDNLISYFLDGAVTGKCHAMDFEDICLDEKGEEINDGDEFENIVLPDTPEDYNTKTCTCHCHKNNTQDEKYLRRAKHCVSCSLQIFEGQPVLKMSRYDYRPVSIVYPSEEIEKKTELAQEEDDNFEKLSKAKIEAAHIALAKAKIQQQQIGKKRKGQLKLNGSKPKRMKQLEKTGEENNSNFNGEINVGPRLECHSTEIVEDKSKTLDKIAKIDIETKPESSVKEDKSCKTVKVKKLKSKSDDIGIDDNEAKSSSVKEKKDKATTSKKDIVIEAESGSLISDKQKDSLKADKSEQKIKKSYSKTVVCRGKKKDKPVKNIVTSKRINKGSQNLIYEKYENEERGNKTVQSQHTKISPVKKRSRSISKTIKSRHCQRKDKTKDNLNSISEGNNSDSKDERKKSKKSSKRNPTKKHVKSQLKTASQSDVDKNEDTSKKMDSSVQDGSSNKTSRLQSVREEGDDQDKTKKLKKNTKVKTKDKSSIPKSQVAGPSGENVKTTGKSTKENPNDEYGFRPAERQPKDVTTQIEIAERNTETLSSLENIVKEKEVAPGMIQSNDKMFNNSPGSQTPITNATDEGNIVDVDNEAASEVFDRFILDNISDEGLSYDALQNIHDKFPLRSMKAIQDRAQQLLSLLETMSDASTDVEEGNKML